MRKINLEKELAFCDRSYNLDKNWKETNAALTKIAVSEGWNSRMIDDWQDIVLSTIIGGICSDCISAQMRYPNANKTKIDSLNKKSAEMKMILSSYENKYPKKEMERIWFEVNKIIKENRAKKDAKH